MLTDIVLPLNLASRNDDIELKYCLRSVEKYLKNFGNVYIIGECPDFINKNTVVHIPWRESTDNKHRALNIYNKIMAAVNYIGDLKFHQSNEDFINNKIEVSAICLSNDFLFMNDDHFLLQNYEAGKFPYYHRGAIDLHKIPNEAQTIQMRNTVNLFLGDVYDFDVHCPIVYNKTKFREVFSKLSWPDYGYGIKSLYCSKRMRAKDGFALNIIRYEDLKLREAMVRGEIYAAIAGRGWFSTGDKCLTHGQLKEVLGELFPLPSKYEIT